MGALPYSESKAGAGREPEIRAMLRGIGASAVGFMQDDDADVVICQFRLHGRQVTVPASVGAYAAARKRHNPRGPRTAAPDWERKARAQAEIAVWAVLADWIKAQAAMIECGFLTMEMAFLPHIHAPDGRRIGEIVQQSSAGLLAPPSREGE
jgi:hypothetical protein